MKVSAVVLTHKRPLHLRRTLRMLESQSVPLHEINVVENDSVGCGVAAARNFCASQCSGDWLLFTYDDGIHMHDMVASLLQRASDLGRDDVLINVPAVDILNGRLSNSEDELYSRVEAYPGRPGDLVRAILSGRKLRFFLEQHCSLIRREYFTSLGGYDAKGFPGWSLHEQDLAIRILQSGGLLDSSTKRVSNGKPLLVFHQVGKTDRLAARKRCWVESSQGDFIRKYGHRFTPSLIDSMIVEAA